MEPTQKQLDLMKDLKVDFDENTVTKEEAKNLISKALSENRKKVEQAKEKISNSLPCYSQNYRDLNGTWRTVKLTAEELMKLRGAHRQHCIQILEECEEDFPNDRELVLAVFDKRADKIFTWIQQELDEKVRQERK
jgi:hypothetical protein